MTQEHLVPAGSICVDDVQVIRHTMQLTNDAMKIGNIFKHSTTAGRRAAKSKADLNKIGCQILACTVQQPNLTNQWIRHTMISQLAIKSIGL